MIIPLVGPSFQLAQVGASSQRTINWYLKRFDPSKGAKSPMIMIPTPGAKVQMDLTALVPEGARCRGIYRTSSGPGPDFQPRVYAVYGSAVLRFNEQLTAAYKLGDIADNGDPVSMCDNGFEFVVADGFSLWSFPLATPDAAPVALTAVALPDAPGTTEPIAPTHVDFLGQRLIINNKRSNQFIFSQLASTEFLPEDFYSAESNSDPILALKTCNGSLWVFGYRSYEVWRGTDNQDSPFTFVGGAQSATGITAPHSLAVIDDKIFWLGSSDVGASGVYMGTGLEANRVSSAGIEDQISELVQPGAAIAWAYSWKGFTHYLLSFPLSEQTYAYCPEIDMWTERLKRDISTSTWRVYPYQWGIYARGQIITGLLVGAKLIALDDRKYTEWDDTNVVRQRISPVYHADLLRTQVRQLLVDAEIGATAFLSGYGSDPQILLEVSKDGGYTYGNVQARSLGGQGEYRKLVRWLALGIARNWVFRFTVSAPVPCAIYQASVTLEPCGSR